MERELVVRFRIDGVLQEIIKPPKRYQNSIVSRVKIMAQLNIAEKRLPQDGRIRIKLAGRDIDIRVSTIPTTHGERIVMRLLDKNATLLDLVEIGMAAETLSGLDALIRRPQGDAGGDHHRGGPHRDAGGPLGPPCRSSSTMR